MNGFNSKAGRIGVAVALLMLAVAVDGAFARGQRRTPGSHICVAKDLSAYEDATETSIQKAINKATQGQVIEILDEGIYEEQITIDGRMDSSTATKDGNSVWNGKNGNGEIKQNKGGITIRYNPCENGAVGCAAASDWRHARPTIKHRDTENTHPRTVAEAGVGSELTGSGNFETCGALRIIFASGVTIEGIAVDGGGPFTFGTKDAWGAGVPLNHGNAAIAVVVSSKVTIRDCDIKNAFFGVSVKDRNPGGVFGNRNPADFEETIALSNFGQVGAHLFEYNRVNGNVVGFFFESAWDLGSSVRYNLIYNNKVTNAGTWSWITPGDNQKYGGGFMFKDMYLSPLAIYNNTLYDNGTNFFGQWQAGGQHLIFNNIFSKVTRSSNGQSGQDMDGRFPNRIYNNVFSADSGRLNWQGGAQFDCPDQQPVLPGGYYVKEVQDQSNVFGKITGAMENLKRCKTDGGAQNDNVVKPGALISDVLGGDGDKTIPAANLNHWLQTEGYGTRLPRLFKSVEPTSADFLVPIWDSTYVKDFIKNKGWKTSGTNVGAGIYNTDGADADLGARPSSGGRQETVVRITPTYVVELKSNGANGDAKFNVADQGRVKITADPKIKFLRWIAPVPENVNSWPSDIKVVPSTSKKDIANTSTIKVGNNNLTFATGTTGNPKYGFFEMMAEGAVGTNKVSTDVGFLPYRDLDYKFTIVVTAPGSSTPLTTVTAGETYRVSITATDKNGNAVTTPIEKVKYDLLSDPSAFMWYATGANIDKQLIDDQNVTFNPKTYDVYFTRAGDETILAAGTLKPSGSSSGVGISGTLDITVKPGKAERAVFADPISLKQIGGPSASGSVVPVIFRGSPQTVKIEIHDRFGNRVEQAVTVSISSDKPDIADIVGAKTATTPTTGANTGIVTFEVKASNDAATGAIFDLTATFPGITNDNNADYKYDNVGRLRVGKPTNQFMIFYSDTLPKSDVVSEYYDPTVTINKNSDEWALITVKVVNADSVKASVTGKYVLVLTAEPNLVFSATAGGAPETMFALTNGVATFWVGAPNATAPIDNAAIQVVMLGSKKPDDIDASVIADSRDGIYFKVQSSTFKHAMVYGDGYGRPDSVVITYQPTSPPFTGSGKIPSKVVLTWGGVDLSSTAISNKGRDFVLTADFTAAAGRPTGYTSVATTPSGIMSGVVTVHGGTAGAEAVEKVPNVYDGVGPVLANGAKDDGAGPENSSGPWIDERGDAAIEDVIEITVSEQIDDVSKLKTIMHSSGAANPGTAAGTRVDVEEAVSSDNRVVTLKVAAAAGIKAGDWIRLDPSGSSVITDRAKTQSGGADGVENNKPHENNRWVQLKLAEKPPAANAWYTIDDRTGKPDYVFVKFSKPVDLKGWFAGGSVKFEDDGSKNVDSASLDEYFQKLGSDTLRITLSRAAPKVAAKIKTSGPMRFTLNFNPSVTWTPKKLDVTPEDRAAPVLADAVILKPGRVKDEKATKPEFYDDTLIVYYSELISEPAKLVTNPVAIKRIGQPYPYFKPNLKLHKINYVSASGKRGYGYWEAAYMIDSLPPPEKGDSVNINYDDLAGIEIGDGIGNDSAGNIQKSMMNKFQPLKIEREPTWTAKIKNNPFRSGASSTGTMEVVMSPNAKGVDELNATAKIRVFDNMGALVIDTTVNSQGDSLAWQWKGQNSKGRLVGTGTYLFKASCEYTKEDKTIDRHRFIKYLGIVRGN